MGILTSPVIEIPANTTLTLQFDFARHVEYYTRATRDRTYVQIRLGSVRVTGGRETITWTGWRTIWARSSRDLSRSVAPPRTTLAAVGTRACRSGSCSTP